MNIRFKDKNLRPDEFSYKTLVVCPKCGGKATVISTQVPQFAELRCSSCHYVTDKRKLRKLAKQNNEYSLEHLASAN